MRLGIIYLLLFVLTAQQLVVAEEKSAAQVFTAYTKALAAGDIKGATEFLHPDELKTFRESMLKMAEMNQEAVRPVNFLEVFEGVRSVEALSALEPKALFTRFLSGVMKKRPSYQKALAEAKIKDLRPVLMKDSVKISYTHEVGSGAGKRSLKRSVTLARHGKDWKILLTQDLKRMVQAFQARLIPEKRVEDPKAELEIEEDEDEGGLEVTFPDDAGDEALRTFDLKKGKQVYSLDLEMSAITNKGLVHLARLPNLTALSLADTLITDSSLVHLNKLRILKSLDLSETGVRDEGLRCVATLPKLESLSLRKNQITDIGLAHLRAQITLVDLNLARTRITDGGLKHLANLTALEILDLDGTQVTSAGLLHLKKLKALDSLWLKGTKVDDAGLQHLSSLTALTGLYLKGTSITDKGLSLLVTHASGLTSLDLRNTKVTDAGMKHLVGLKSLTCLTLEGSGITNKALQSIKNMANLTELNLENTNVDDKGLLLLGALKALEDLDVSNSKVTNKGAKQLKKLLPDLDIYGLD